MKTNTQQFRHSGKMKMLFAALFIAFTCMQAKAQNIINTVAGNGTAGYSGDGGPATNALLYQPMGIYCASSGNYYFTDPGNYVVRKVDAAGIITTIAGNYALGAGLSGNNGPATAAQLYYPADVTVDAAGNCYIADGLEVRRVDGTTGIITTYAGGSWGYGGDNGPATNASFNIAWGIAIDGAGNIYVADQFNNVIRKINTAGIISTIAGNYSLGAGYSGDGGPATAAQLYFPNGVAVDGANNIYIADYGNFCIRKVDGAGTITTIAGNGIQSLVPITGGAATAAEFDAPVRVAVDGSGNVYASDLGLGEVYKIDGSGIITPIAGGGGSVSDGIPATDAFLYATYGISFGACGDLFIAGYYVGYDIIRKVAFAVPIIGPSSVCVTSTITLSDPISGGTWSSGATSVATIGSSSGIVTGVSLGTTVITYTTSCFSAWDTITVVNSASVSGPSAVCGGSTISLISVPSSGTWSSSNTAIATVDGIGTVTGVSAGAATITFVSACGTATYPITVNTMATITGSVYLCSTGSTTISNSPGGGTWSSSNTAVATVSTLSAFTANVTGVSAGTAIITYTSIAGCMATTTATIMTSGTISGPSTVCTGATIALSDGIPGGTWSSSNTSAATVDPATGIVTGVAVGTAIISYNDACGADIYTVSVTATPTITGTPLVCMGSGGVTISASTSGGTWSSANTSIATISTSGSSGIITGVSAGTTTLTYTWSGCAATITATVVPMATACVVQGFDPTCGCHVFTITGTPGATANISFETCIGVVISSTSVPVGARIAASGTPVTFPLGTCKVCVNTVSYMGCTWASSCCDDVNHGRQANPAGVQAVNGESTLTVIPNPSKGTLTISGELQYGGTATSAKIEIVDMLGKTVYTDVATLQNGTIDKTITLGSAIPNGIYLVKVRNDDASEVVRFTLER